MIFRKRLWRNSKMSDGVDECLTRINEIIDLLSQIEQDKNVPKNIRGKITDTICCLKEEESFDLKISKVISELDMIVDDTNLPSYTRTQVWNIVSLLESNEQ